MRQVLDVGARLFSASIAPVVEVLPASIRNSFALGLVLGAPLGLGAHQHRALPAHRGLGRSSTASISPGTDRARDLWGLLRGTLSARLRLRIDLDLGACHRP